MWSCMRQAAVIACWWALIGCEPGIEAPPAITAGGASSLQPASIGSGGSAAPNRGNDRPQPGAAPAGAGGPSEGPEPGPLEQPGSGGTDGSGGSSLEPGAEPPISSGGFLDLSPPRGEPFDPAQGTPLDPPPPPGWTWYSVPGTSCRDGSEAGLFIRFSDSNRLLIFFEGGGACTTAGFCSFNPANVNQVLLGTGETVLGTALGAQSGRQQPGAYQNGEVTGILSAERSENPMRDWNMVYIPYCTGDVHFGTRTAGRVAGLAAPQMFVGALNTRTFVGRLVPTFEEGLERVVVAGSSAGSFGAALNLSMISDAFSVQTDALLDSGVPFQDEFWPTCLQQTWRELFGLNEALPPDCEQCFNDDGGGLIGLSDFLTEKHPTTKIALLSSIHDEVIRLFFTPGLDECATVTTADPVGITLGQLTGAQLFPPERYEAGLLGVRAEYADSGLMATYFLAGPNEVLHQHAFRPRFFQVAAGSLTPAQFVGNFLEGQMDQVGP